MAPVSAQDATKPADDSAPALKPGTFTLPPSNYDMSKFRYDPPSDPTSGFNAPNQVDLGTSTLKFDAGRKEPTNKVGIEAVNPTQLGDIQKQQSTVLPNYLGLTLSKPLN
ncbi:MAG TPA: hypothetical protein VG270_04795 [Pseudolabrys sp.]|nr:hypothetical protein [Pseudolabrys sp.]